MDLKERYLVLLKSIREILKNEDQMHMSFIRKRMNVLLDECLQLEKDIAKEKEWEVGGSGLTEEEKQEINNSLLELKSKIDNQDKKIDKNSSQIDEKAKNLQTQVNNIVTQAGNPEAVSAEIAQARGNFPVLNERFQGIEDLANDTKDLLNYIKDNGYVLDVYNKINLIPQELVVTEGKNYGQWNFDGSIDATMSQYKPTKYKVNGYNYIFIEYAKLACSSSKAALLWMDNNEKVLLYDNTSLLYENISLSVPDGAYYLCLSQPYNDYNAKIYTATKTTNTALQDIKLLSDEVENIKTSFNENTYYYVEDSYINYIEKKSPGLVLKDGSVATVGVTTLCVTYDVTNIEKLKFEMLVIGTSSNKNYTSYVFLNDNGEVLSYDDSIKTTVENIDVLVPRGATKLKVNISAEDSNLSKTKLLSYKKNNIKDEVMNYSLQLDNFENEVYNTFEKSLEGVYDDFSIKPNTNDIRGIKLFSGQTWNVTGTAAENVSIKNGELTNFVGNFYMFVPIKNPKFMSMKFSFKLKDEIIENPSGTPLCVIIYEGVKNDLLDFIHLTFSHNSVDVSVRNNTEEFLRNFTILHGNYYYETIKDGEIVEVKTWLDGNLLYIIKPDGNLFVLQSDDFLKEIGYAKWQITSASNANTKGYIHEVCAGVKNASSVFRMAKKNQMLMLMML